MRAHIALSAVPLIPPQMQLHVSLPALQGGRSRQLPHSCLPDGCALCPSQQASAYAAQLLMTVGCQGCINTGASSSACALKLK